MLRGKKHWKQEAQKAQQREFHALLDLEISLSLLRRLIKALEIDGFGHVKDIHAGDATEIYHEYLDNFPTKGI